MRLFRFPLEVAAILSLSFGLATNPAQVTAQRSDLDAYAGVYQYRYGATVAIIPKNTDLVAIIGQALYSIKYVKETSSATGVARTSGFNETLRASWTGSLKEKTFSCC